MNKFTLSVGFIWIRLFHSERPSLSFHLFEQICEMLCIFLDLQWIEVPCSRRAEYIGHGDCTTLVAAPFGGLMHPVIWEIERVLINLLRNPAVYDINNK